MRRCEMLKEAQVVLSTRMLQQKRPQTGCSPLYPAGYEGYPDGGRQDRCRKSGEKVTKLKTP